MIKFTVKNPVTGEPTDCEIVVAMPATRPGDRLEHAVIHTVDWTHLDEDGRPVKFTLANARRLYNDYPWLMEQVLEVIGEPR